MTPKEFRLLMKAKEYRDVDKMFWTTRQAFTTVLAGGHKKNGKPVYRTEKALFDYKQAQENLSKNKKDEVENDILRRQREFYRKKREGTL